ncbi:MAG: hypothetical protein AMXMBFR37_05680 [Steroidobacteraceae bacterium]
MPGTLLNEAAAAGRLEEAGTLARRLAESDPVSAVNRGNLGVYRLAAGKPAEALIELRKALVLHGRGDPAGALAILREMESLAGTDEAFRWLQLASDRTVRAD